MAVDMALLDLASDEGRAVLRLYRWDPYCLSFGRHEPALRRYDRGRIDDLGLDCVRRPTGGRAVWHARELTYAVAAPLRLFGGLRETYHAIHAALARAIERLGARPVLASAEARPSLPSHPGSCFAAPVGGEVLLEGRKAVGSAQLRRDEAVLQHGSLLLEDDQSLVAELGSRPGAPRAEITLSEALGRPVGWDAAAQAIRAEWDDSFACRDAGNGLLDRIRTRAALHAPHFRDAGWTWSR